MAEIKLAKLPDRTPVKLAVLITPDLHCQLQQYAAAYSKVYGTQEALTDLIPAMLSAFLESDRTFMRSRSKS